MATRSYNGSEVSADLYARIPQDGELQLLLGNASINDVLPSLWQYVASSSATDNYSTLGNVIQPTLQTGNGRWLRRHTYMTLAQAQMDLNAMQIQIDSKMPMPTGGAGEYIRGDGTIATFPSIPSAQVQSDWNATTGLAAIANKPTVFSGVYADLTSKPTLGTAAAANTIDFATAAQGALAVSALQPAGNGSALTGLTKTQVGLPNADNTSDANKPVSTAQAAAIALKENTANKQNSLTADGTGVKFPTVDAVNGALAGKFNNPSGSTSQIILGNGSLGSLPTAAGVNNAAAYGAGTAYSLTGTSAKVTFGTTSPSITIPAAGTYLIMANVKIEYSGLLTLGATTANLKLRRTNNTAADIANATTTYNVPAIALTALTQTAGDADIAPVIYTTANSNDVIEIWGSRGANVSAGSIQIGEASIVAIRLY